MSTILGVYLKNEGAIKRFLRRYIKSRDAIEDLAQETVLRAFAAESERFIESPKAFLFTVARNLALNEIARKSTAAIESIGDFEDSDVLEDTNQAAVDDVVDGGERVRQLARAIAALPPQCAKVFILRKIQGLSQKEIASRLNISVRTVEAHVAHGLVRCKAYLRAQGCGPDVADADSRKVEQPPTAFRKVERK